MQGVTPWNKSSLVNLGITLFEVVEVKLQQAIKENIVKRVTPIIIEPSLIAASTQLTLKGLEPNKTYYKYQDSYRNLAVFVSDENGNYSWLQDLSRPHHIWIQEIKSTVFLPKDCSKYGIWNETTKTCALIENLTEPVEIEENNITLDCNTYNITGAGAGYGIYLNNKTGVTAKNCNISNFHIGIYLSSSTKNTLIQNIATSNKSAGIWLSSSNENTLAGNITNLNTGYGIFLYNSNANIVASNTASNNNYGIILGISTSNKIANNFIKENNYGDLSVFGSAFWHFCNNIFENNIGSGDRAIKVFNNSVNLQNEILSELVLCNADNSNIDNVIIEGSPTKKNNGLYLIGTDNSNFRNITSSDNNFGIYFISSSQNSFMESTVLNNDTTGIFLYDSNNNNFRHNKVNSNNWHDLRS